VLLDNEAVQALVDPRHHEHRAVLAVFEVVAQRKQRGAVVDPVVPTAVRVEAGWDRTAPSAALVNSLRIRDVALDGLLADRAVQIRDHARVSVVDAHLGAVVATATAERISVITSDAEDMLAVVGNAAVTVVPL